MMKWKEIRRLLAICSAVYFLMMALIYVTQRSHLYFPDKEYTSPNVLFTDNPFEEIRSTTEDGINLVGWYAPPTDKKTTIVFFHGNADNLYKSTSVAYPYIQQGYGFHIVEYRGFSGLEGSPSESGLYHDARANIKTLISRGIKEHDLVLFGHSLGTAVAVQMATEFNVKALILLAPFSSISKMAQIRFPFFPSQYLVKDKFESDKKISKINMPVLIANAGKDQVVPPRHANDLYQLANEPKKLVFSPNAGHNNLLSEGNFLPESLAWLMAIHRSAEHQPDYPPDKSNPHR